MRELSSKLKKIVCVNESENKMHNYNPVNHSLNNLMSLNVDVPAIKSSANNNIKYPISIISNHLRKHATNLIKMAEIPNMRAQFQCKFVDLSFPIGVRSCNSRNLLIVCDSANNAVKIFNKDTAKLLHTINGHLDKNNPKQLFTMQRPSAVLINQDNQSEIFVKDDKEILVFDLNDNCRFRRKFGYQILRRPYGLAFNTNGNIVLVDADVKNPLIYIFDKNTGKVIDKKPYQPVLPNYSHSESLKYQIIYFKLRFFYKYLFFHKLKSYQ
jgi:WD40 repeat protein